MAYMLWIKLFTSNVVMGCMTMCAHELLPVFLNTLCSYRISSLSNSKNASHAIIWMFKPIEYPCANFEKFARVSKNLRKFSLSEWQFVDPTTKQWNVFFLGAGISKKTEISFGWKNQNHWNEFVPTEKVSNTESRSTSHNSSLLKNEISCNKVIHRIRTNPGMQLYQFLPWVRTFQQDCFC